MNMLLDSFLPFGAGAGDGGGAGGDYKTIEFVGSDAQAVNVTNALLISDADIVDELGALPTFEAGDVMVIVFALPTSNSDQTSSARFIPPPGFTLVDKAWQTNVNLYVAYAPIFDPDYASYAVDGAGFSGTTYAKSVASIVFRGVDLDEPFAATVGSDSTHGSLPDPASVTPTRFGSFPMILAGGGGSSMTANHAYDRPSEVSAETNHYRTAYGSDNFDSVVGIGFADDWTAGAFDPSQLTSVSSPLSGHSHIAFTAVLQAAPIDQTLPTETAIQYVGGKQLTFTQTTTTSLTDLQDDDGNTITLQENDLVVITVAEAHDTTTIPAANHTPSGYTNIDIDQDFGGSYSVALSACYKVMGGTPDTTVDVTVEGTSGSFGKAAIIRVFRGVNTSSPIDTTATNVGSNSTFVDMPQITPTASNPMIVAASAVGDNVSSDIYVHARPINMLSWRDVRNNQAIDAALTSGHFPYHQSGVFDAGYWITTTAENYGVGLVFALNPA